MVAICRPPYQSDTLPCRCAQALHLHPLGVTAWFQVDEDGEPGLHIPR